MSLLRRKSDYIDKEDRDAIEHGRHSPRRGGQGLARRSGRPRTVSLTAVLCTFVFLLLYLHYAFQPHQKRPNVLISAHSHICKLKNTFDRPSRIGCKVEAALHRFEAMIARQSRTVEEAMVNYRKRYHRAPPPGFEQWVEYALAHNASIIDDYDQIDIDMRPFRKYSSVWLKQRIGAAKASWPTAQLGSITVDNGMLNIDGNRHLGALSASTLETILEPIADKLPNLEILFNWYAEPRVRASNQNHTQKAEVQFLDYSHMPTWEFLTATCANSTYMQRLWHQTNEICRAKVDLEEFHGFFNAPNQFRPTEDLVPMLSRAKLSTFQDILVPNVCYADANWRLFDYRDTLPFSEKYDSIHWRGSSTGQQQTRRNWSTSHRVRLVRYTQWLQKMASRLQANPEETPNGMTAATAKALSRLEPETFDIGFTSYVNCETQVCKALEANMGLLDKQAPTEAFAHKFVFDADGQSMSCRFYRLLETNSVVFKSTIWNEWHGDRLVPWLHYVPVSVNLQEIPELLDYFINNPRGKEYAEIIALASRSWSESSLRVVDLTIYYYRLLLEFGALLQ